MMASLILCLLTQNFVDDNSCNQMPHFAVIKTNKYLHNIVILLHCTKKYIYSELKELSLLGQADLYAFLHKILYMTTAADKCRHYVIIKTNKYPHNKVIKLHFP